MNMPDELAEVLSYLHTPAERAQLMAAYAAHPNEVVAGLRKLLAEMDKLRKTHGAVFDKAKCDSAQVN